MQNKIWKSSVFSDGSLLFLSDPEPDLNQAVKVRIRICRENPVQKVLLRLIRNGGTEIYRLQESVVFAADPEFIYYEAELVMTQERLSYHFILLTDDFAYYYNQAGLQEVSPDRHHDFVVQTCYHQPAWVKSAVFYQIFPERFCNGNPSLTVKDGEYEVNGYPVFRVKDWNQPAGTYAQCHCADFYGGDLEGIRHKIPYLKELGVTALYLNPIFMAPSVHKYDCIDYLHVDPHFGGDEALALLSSELHENGMKLILDISINHTGTAHRWFNRDGLYFAKSIGAYNNPASKERSYYVIHEDGTYECWDNVPELPKMDFDSEELRQALYKASDSVLKKWLLPPYSIDGWRFDVADVMANYNTRQLAREVWPQIREAIRSVNPDAYILAEHWDDCCDFLQGDSWDAPMNYYGFGRIIRQFYGCPDPIAEREADLWPCTCHLTAEQFQARVMNYLSALPFSIWQNQYNLFDSHDIGRFHIYPGMNAEKYRGAVIAMFTMIGTPSIYYGDEAGIGGAVGFFEGGRYPMPWDSGFEKSDIYHLYQTLAHLRQEHAVFSDGSFAFMYAKEQVLAFLRFNRTEAYLTVISGNNQEVEISLTLSVVGEPLRKKFMDRCKKEFPKAQGIELSDAKKNFEDGDLHSCNPVDGDNTLTDVLGRDLHYTCKDDQSVMIRMPAYGAFLI